MTRTVLTFTLAAGVVITLGCGGDRKSDAVAIRYADRVVTLDEFEEEFRRKGEFDVAPTARDSVLEAFANGLVDKLVMAYEATHEPRGDTTGLARDLDHTRRTAILDLYRSEQEATLDLSEERLDQVWEWLDEEYLARHILCETREDAAAVMVEIEGGADFAALAREKSLDAFTAEQGGLLPWAAYGEFEGIDDAVFALERGQAAGPVFTHRGWHVVRLEDKRPRERTEVEEHPALFARDYEARLKKLRWDELLRTVWETYDIEWLDEGYQTALALQLDYRDRYRAKLREFNRLQEEGKPIDESFRRFPRGPEPTDEQARQTIARSGGFTFTVGDAVNATWMTPMNARPSLDEPRVYEDWVRGQGQEYLLVYDADTGSFLEDPDRDRTVRNVVEFSQVERLYQAEVYQKTQPTDVDLTAFYEEYQEHYKFPPDLDLVVFRVEDNATAVRIRDALVEKRPSEEIQEQFGSSAGLEMIRTGPKREFPEFEGLTELARRIWPEVGQVSDVAEVDGKLTVVRVEAIGEADQMSFDDAYEYLFRDCAAFLRENRTRSFLDSLQTAYDARIDFEVLQRADIWTPQ